jgi:hypothetical protein
LETFRRHREVIEPFVPAAVMNKLVPLRSTALASLLDEEVSLPLTNHFTLLSYLIY